jgi:hypothetical protein
MPSFGRLEEFDDASREYPAVGLLTSRQREAPRTKTWRCDSYLDQGEEGACVGFAIAHELASSPVKVPVDAETAFDIYYEAQRVDQWPGGAYPDADPYYEGTSVIAGLKIAKKMGLITEYRWAFGLDDLVLAVGYLGPSVIGVPWYQGMHTPDAKGYIAATGKKTGGHAVLVRGVSLRRKSFLIHNSWGRNWGVKGTAWLRFSDMDKLLQAKGEAAIPLVRHRRIYTLDS